MYSYCSWDCNRLQWIEMDCNAQCANCTVKLFRSAFSLIAVSHWARQHSQQPWIYAEDDIIINCFAGTFNITPRVGSILFFSNTLFPTHPGNRGFYFRSLKEEEENVVKSPHGEDPIIANFAVGGSHTAYHQKSNTGQPDIFLPQCRFWIITGSDTANKPHLRSTGKVLSEGSDNC